VLVSSKAFRNLFEDFMEGRKRKTCHKSILHSLLVAVLSVISNVNNDSYTAK